MFNPSPHPPRASVLVPGRHLEVPPRGAFRGAPRTAGRSVRGLGVSQATALVPGETPEKSWENRENQGNIIYWNIDFHGFSWILFYAENP